MKEKIWNREELQPILLEGFKPICESLEWRIMEAYWESSGSDAFKSREVPYLVTNDGMLAARAADVLLKSCQLAEANSRLEDEIKVAEFGVGLGLNASLFLDQFKSKCIASQVDYYDRLTFFATDRSLKMLTDIRDFGILDRHQNHVRMGRLNALEPKEFFSIDTGNKTHLRDLRAVFHSYMLDTLPFDILLQEGKEWMRLHFKTRIDVVTMMDAALKVDLPNIATWAASDDIVDLSKLLPFRQQFTVERAFLPIERSRLPFRAVVESFAEAVREDAVSKNTPGVKEISFSNPHGAVFSILATLDILNADGFLLFNDYGSTRLNASNLEHQRYSGSRSMGLNFAMLHHALESMPSQPVCILVPEGDHRATLHSRLIAKAEDPVIEEVFQELFALSQFESCSRLMEQAQVASKEGALQEAQQLYIQAHQQYPENWYVLVEWAEFSTNKLHDLDQSLNLARKAIEMNPRGSPLLHNVIGDALFRSGQHVEALAAYGRALEIRPTDIRGHASLGLAYAGLGSYGMAIVELAAALANDEKAEFRLSLMQTLNEILDRRDAMLCGIE